MSETTDPSPTPEATESDRPSAGAPAEAAQDDGGAALERAQEAIDAAQDAEGTVAAHDDITTHDAALAGEYSEDPDGTGGHP